MLPVRTERLMLDETTKGSSREAKETLNANRLGLGADWPTTKLVCRFDKDTRFAATRQELRVQIVKGLLLLDKVNASCFGNQSGRRSPAPDLYQSRQAEMSELRRLLEKVRNKH